MRQKSIDVFSDNVRNVLENKAEANNRLYSRNNHQWTVSESSFNDQLKITVLEKKAEFLGCLRVGGSDEGERSKRKKGKEILRRESTIERFADSNIIHTQFNLLRDASLMAQAVMA